ncbi:hypothetical protein FOA52_005235 [Chlamydomonas sp. UWO 241]|nr:hypothetical protein FOA52_005235 [Chlamydomonas sp. UWO 241]
MFRPPPPQVHQLIDKAETNSDLLCDMLCNTSGTPDDFEAELIRDLVTEVRELRELFNAYLEQMGSMEGPDMEQLLASPLDLRYSQLYGASMARIPSYAWARAAVLHERVLCAQARAQHLALCARAQDGAGAPGLPGSGATPYQVSHWRSTHPMERAETAAQHAVIDWLAPLLDVIAVTEGELLSLPLALPVTHPGAAGSEAEEGAHAEAGLVRALARMQRWRNELWGVINGPVTRTSAASADAQPGGDESKVDLSALTWTWRRLDKSLRLVLKAGAASAVAACATPPPSSARLAHVSSSTGASLGLDAAPDKPLAWAHAGRPALPRSRALLAAGLALRRLARALGAGEEPMGDAHGGAVGGAASHAAAAGVTAALRDVASAGVPLPRMLSECAARVGELESAGPTTESVSRELLGAGVLAVLRSDAGLKRSVARGLALLGALFDAEASNGTASKGPQSQQAVNDARAAASRQGLELSSQLVAEVTRRCEAAAHSATQLLLEAPPGAFDGSDAACAGGEASSWLLQLTQQQNAAGVVVGTSGPAGPAGGGGASPSLLEVSSTAALLPPGLMVSPVCRTLQASLMAVVDLDTLYSQRGLLSSATLAVMATLSGAGSHAQRVNSLDTALTASRRHVAAALHAGSGRSPADFVPHMQLAWELEEVLRTGASGGAGAAGGRQASVRERQLAASLHEMWLSWHGAVWDCASARRIFVAATAGAAPGDSAGGPAGGAAAPLALAMSHVASALTAAPTRMYLAAGSQAAAALLLGAGCTVQTKPLRLLQLRLAARHLQTQAAQPGVGASGPPGASGERAESHVPCAQAALLCQLLLAHAQSLDARRQGDLVALTQQLLALASGSAPSVPSESERSAWLALLSVTLSSSSHAGLRQLTPSLLLPCAASLLEALAPSHSQQYGDGARVRRVLATHGRVWLMLGTARLHLVAPPRGIDPAGKYRLKASSLQAHIGEVLDVESAVRSALQALPGGHDESGHLARLSTERTATESALRAVISKVVPRPAVDRYGPLADDVAAFAGSLGAVERVLSLCAALEGLALGGGADGAADALQEASIWTSNAGVWAERVRAQYEHYLDVVQPVVLAVQEARHGLSLLSAAAAMSSGLGGAGGSASASGTGGSLLLPPAQQDLALAAAAALLSFPPAAHLPGAFAAPSGQLLAASAAAPGSAESAAAALLLLPATALGDEQALRLFGALAASSALAAAPAHLEPHQLSKLADGAAYAARLQALRIALHAGARATMSAAGGSGCAADGERGAALLGRMEGVWAQLWDSWTKVKAYEEARAFEEAEIYKTKVKTVEILGADADDEATYSASTLNPWAAFSDLVPADGAGGEGGPPDPVDADGKPLNSEKDSDAAAPPEEATETQARSAATKQLTDGELLEDLVACHCSSVAALSFNARGGAAGSGDAWLSDKSSTRAFRLSYDLGARLLGWAGGALPSRLDAASATGHLMRCVLEHQTLDRAPAATGALAAAGTATGSSTKKGSGSRGRKGAPAASASAAASCWMLDDDDDDCGFDGGFGAPGGDGVDINGPCVEEIVLLQAPLAGVDARLRTLLAEFPDNPTLLQLSALATRCLGLPVTSPLKTALTGLELLLARAQLWEESAAKYVTMGPELQAVGAVATRWRQLELTSWVATLKTVVRKHSGGARRSWFHLYGLLVLGKHEDQADATDGAGRSGAAPELGEWERRYRTVASAIEAFVQTSTIGEFEARLRMLASFRAHVGLRLASSPPGEACDLAAHTHAALGNTVRYYRQFSPAVRKALESGLSPHEKDLAGFVQLAKWEDRGYYALKASADKAQRYLHRLRRRAEEALSEPVATVMAGALKSMGVQELAKAAAAVAPEPVPVAAPPPVPVEQTEAELERKKKLSKKERAREVAKEAADLAKAAKAHAAAAASAEDPTAAPIAGLEVEEVTGLGAADMALAGSAPNLSAWGAFVSGALALGPAPPAAAQAAEGGAADASYAARLPKLTRQLAKVLSASLAAASAPPPPAKPAAPAIMGEDDPEAGAGEEEEEEAPLVAWEAVEELAVSAAVRASELRGDGTKGARLRKQKALSDLLHALGALGLSRRAADVPKGDRTATDWFKHAPPDMVPLLMGAGGSAVPPASLEALGAARELWGRADVYYFRALARLQKLQACAKAPHRDVSPGEALSATRLCEHTLYLARNQRRALAGAAAAAARLARLASWMAELAATATAAATTSAPSHDAVVLAGGGAPPLAQPAARVWLRAQKARLERCTLVAGDVALLLAGVRDVAAVPSAAPAVARAAGVAHQAAAALRGAKQALEAVAAECTLPAAAPVDGAVPAPPSAGDGSVGDGDSCVWVTVAAQKVVAANYATLLRLHADAAALLALAAGPAASAGVRGGAQPSGAPDSSVVPPGLERLVSELAAAADEARAFDAASATAAVAAPVVGAANGSGAAAEAEAAASAEASLEASVKAMLLWAQGLSAAAQPPLDSAESLAAKHAAGSAAAVSAAAAGAHEVGTLPAWMANWERGAGLRRASEVAARAADVLRHLGAAGGGSAAQSLAARIAALAPGLRLVAGCLQQWALPAVSTHKATCKLGYICTAVLSTLVAEGYCITAEGEGGEGGDGKGDFKDAGGTGLGEGNTTNAKDISDQLVDEDQLLGAEQKDREKKEEAQDEKGGKDEKDKGIEMDDDFDGSLEDMDAPRDDGEEPSEDEAGDDERIDQQMGEDLGENQDAVDERMWGEDDVKDEKGDDKTDRDNTLQVADKSELEYGAGGEEKGDEKKENKKDKGKEEAKKEKEEKKEDGKKQGEEGAAEEEQVEDGEDGEEGGGVNEDMDDNYEDKNFTKPEEREDELTLPDNMNLDGADDDGKEPPQQNEEGEGPPDEKADAPEGAEGEEPKVDEGAEDPPPGGDDAMDVEGEADRGGDLPDEQAGARADQQDGDAPDQHDEEGKDEGGPPGDAQAAQEQPEDEPEASEGEDGAKPVQGEEEKVADEAQQAGPRGVASAAAPAAASTGAATGMKQADGEEEKEQDAAASGAADAGTDAPDAAPQARQGMAGLSSADDRGAPAPLQGTQGERGGEQQRGRQRQQQKAEPNPLRSLGDALEKWRADLSVAHEAPETAEDAGDDAAHDPSADDGAPTDAGGLQFLNADEGARAGDTQALAPATEEQAKDSLNARGYDEEQPGGQEPGADGDDGAAAAAQPQEDEPMADAGGDDQTADEAQAAGAVAGVAPRKWGGSSKPTQQGKDEEGAESEGDGGEGEGDAVAAEEARRKALLDSLAAGGADRDEDDALLDDLAIADAARAAAAMADGADAALATLAIDGEGGVVQRDIEMDEAEAAEARAALEAQLRAAAASAAEDGIEGGAALAAYGAEVWARCEALTAGLSSELTEQLRLILEPTLASKMAGDYKTGKRINMKKVIAYIASHFRKDKIWMRRARPDKRRYQIVLAVDDSRSMAENGCGGVALEALALITKSMSRLEVGQVGVLKFGGADGVVPLQALDAPFSDAVGPRLASSLRFQGESTIADAPVAQLMAGLGSILDTARHSSGAGGIGAGTSDLSQLVIILADGRFHERESLKAAVREVASRPGVCLAFLALDSAANGGSLLDMQTVSFHGGKPVFTKYLDAFPFPYYVLLRDVGALPRTLAGLLRQWFELQR